MLGIAIVAGSIAWLIGRSISRPLNQLGARMQALADGSLEAEIPGVGRGDEIGAMAATVQIFKDNAVRIRGLEKAEAETQARAAAERRAAMEGIASDFERSVNGIVRSVQAAAAGMQTTAQSMTATASDASARAATVGAASDSASSNVGTVAAAAEELSSSVTEISRQVTQSSEQQGEATREIARNIQQVAAGSSEISAHIGGVTTAATATGSAASDVLSNARELDNQSGMLRNAVDGFLAKVRAA